MPRKLIKGVIYMYNYYEEKILCSPIESLKFSLVVYGKFNLIF